MIIVILLPCLFIFLYCLYKFIKDDYIFVKKNITVEQLFDILFLSLCIGLLGARISFFLFHRVRTVNIFLTFFSFRLYGLSLTGGVILSIFFLYMVGKYRKIPLGRFLDFVALAFLITLPIGFAAYSLFFRNDRLLLALISALFYFLFNICCLRFIYPKLLSRTFHEGTLTLLFLLYFAFVSLFINLLQSSKGQLPILDAENIVLVCLFFFSCGLLLRQRADKSKRK